MGTVETTILKDGTEVMRVVAVVVFKHMQHLREEYPLAFYDAVMMARDKTYQPFGSNAQHLRDCALLETDGHMHSEVAAIVRNCAEGEGLQMRLVSPISKEPA